MIPEQTFYSVSDNAHFLAGMLAVLGPLALGVPWPWFGAVAIVLWATWKEFYWDPRHELPIIAGPSGWRDWFGYVLGAAAGLVSLPLAQFITYLFHKVIHI